MFKVLDMMIDESRWKPEEDFPYYTWNDFDVPFDLYDKRFIAAWFKDSIYRYEWYGNIKWHYAGTDFCTIDSVREEYYDQYLDAGNDRNKYYEKVLGL